jgi:hypothetical protein
MPSIAIPSKGIGTLTYGLSVEPFTTTNQKTKAVEAG